MSSGEGINLLLLLEAKDRATEQLTTFQERLDSVREKFTTLAGTAEDAGLKIDKSLESLAGFSQQDVDAFARMAESAGLSDEALAKYNEQLRITAEAAATTATQDEYAASLDRVAAAAGITAADLDKLKASSMELAASEDKAALSADKEAASVEKAGTAGETSGGKFSKLQKGAAIAGLAIVGIGVEAIKSAVKYQSAMTTIQNNGDLTTKQTQQLQQAFLATAGTSTESAAEMAAAYGPVAGEFESLNGTVLTSSQTMQVMKASTDLADASGESLTNTTKTLADTMSVYHLKTSQASMVSNVLFNTSRRLGTSVSQLGQQMGRIEPRIVGSGMSVQQLSGFMLELSNVAGKGRQAMRLAGQGIQQLITPSAAAQKQLGEMGVSLTDSNGKFIGMQKALGVLHTAFAKLPGPAAAMAAAQKLLANQTELANLKTEAQTPALKKQEAAITAQDGVLTIHAAALSKTSVLQSLFGRQANIMAEMIAGGTTAFNQNVAAVSASGKVQSAAARNAATFAGQMKTLKATASDLTDTLGTALLPIVMSVAKEVLAIVKPIASWIEKNKTLAGIILATVAAIGLLLGVVMMAAKVIEAFNVVLTLLSANPVVLLIMAIVAAVVILIAIIYEIYKHWNTIWGEIKAITEDVWHGGIEPVFDALKMGANLVWSVLQTAWNAIDDVIQFVGNHIVQIIKIIIAVGLGPLGVAIDILWTHWHSIWGFIQQMIDDVWSFIKPIFDAIIHDGLELIEGAINVLKGVWDTVWGAIEKIAGDAWTWLDSNVIQPVTHVFDVVLSNSLNTFSDLWHTIWDGIQSAVQDVWSVLQPIFSSITSAVSAITSGISSVMKVVGGAGSAIGKVIGFIGGKAEGGPVSAGSTWLVGEKGPELFTPSVNGTITPHSGVSAVLSPGMPSQMPMPSYAPPSSGGGGANQLVINVNLQGQVYGSLDALVQKLGKDLATRILPQAGVSVRNAG